MRAVAANAVVAARLSAYRAWCGSGSVVRRRTVRCLSTLPPPPPLPQPVLQPPPPSSSSPPQQPSSSGAAQVGRDLVPLRGALAAAVFRALESRDLSAAAGVLLRATARHQQTAHQPAAPAVSVFMRLLDDAMEVEPQRAAPKVSWHRRRYESMLTRAPVATSKATTRGLPAGTADATAAADADAAAASDSDSDMDDDARLRRVVEDCAAVDSDLPVAPAHNQTLVFRCKLLLDLMQHMGAPVDTRTMNTFMQACADAGYSGGVFMMWSRMHAAGLLPDRTTMSILLGVSSRMVRPNVALRSAKMVFRLMQKYHIQPSASMYTTYISILGANEKHDLALEVFLQLRRDGYKPDATAFSALIGASINSPNSTMFSWLIGEIKEARVELDDVSWMLLLKLAAKLPKGRERALQVFETARATLPAMSSVLASAMLAECSTDPKMTAKVLDVADRCPNKSLVLVNAMILACGLLKDVKRAQRCYQDALAAGLEPDVITYSSLMEACVAGNAPAQAYAAFEDMRARRVPPDRHTYRCVLRALAEMKDFERAIPIYDYLLVNHHLFDLSMGHTFISAAVKSGKLPIACDIAAHLTRKGVARPTTMAELAAEFLKVQRYDAFVLLVEQLRRMDLMSSGYDVAASQPWRALDSNYELVDSKQVGIALMESVLARCNELARIYSLPREKAHAPLRGVKRDEYESVFLTLGTQLCNTDVTSRLLHSINLTAAALDGPQPRKLLNRISQKAKKLWRRASSVDSQR